MDRIDRVAPTRRPAARARAVMYQRWSHLLFLHWQVPADLLRELLPPGLELDTYEDKAYVGLVPFTMSGVRPWWAPPLPWLSRFDEVNVRTYVHVRGRDPGVWFFSLDAANPLAVRMARWRFRLPYYHARMKLVEERPASSGGGTDPEITYRSQRVGVDPRAAFCRLRYQPRGESAPAKPGTIDHFLVERYILYAFAGSALYRGRVHHSAYPLRRAELFSLEENLLAASGITPPAVAPLVHYASAVRVEIFPLEPVVP